jgi:hypothetical protein
VERIADGENAYVPTPGEGEVTKANPSEHVQTVIGRENRFRVK